MFLKKWKNQSFITGIAKLTSLNLLPKSLKYIKEKCKLAVLIFKINSFAKVAKFTISISWNLKELKKGNKKSKKVNKTVLN